MFVDGYSRCLGRGLGVDPQPGERVCFHIPMIGTTCTVVPVNPGQEPEAIAFLRRCVAGDQRACRERVLLEFAESDVQGAFPREFRDLIPPFPAMTRVRNLRPTQNFKALRACELEEDIPDWTGFAQNRPRHATWKQLCFEYDHNREGRYRRRSSWRRVATKPFPMCARTFSDHFEYGTFPCLREDIARGLPPDGDPRWQSDPGLRGQTREEILSYYPETSEEWFNQLAEAVRDGEVTPHPRPVPDWLKDANARIWLAYKGALKSGATEDQAYAAAVAQHAEIYSEEIRDKLAYLEESGVTTEQNRAAYAQWLAAWDAALVQVRQRQEEIRLREEQERAAQREAAAREAEAAAQRQAEYERQQLEWRENQAAAEAAAAAEAEAVRLAVEQAENEARRRAEEEARLAQIAAQEEAARREANCTQLNADGTAASDVRRACRAARVAAQKEAEAARLAEEAERMRLRNEEWRQTQAANRERRAAFHAECVQIIASDGHDAAARHGCRKDLDGNEYETIDEKLARMGAEQRARLARIMESATADARQEEQASLFSSRAQAVARGDCQTAQTYERVAREKGWDVPPLTCTPASRAQVTPKPPLPVVQAPTVAQPMVTAPQKQSNTLLWTALFVGTVVAVAKWKGR